MAKLPKNKWVYVIALGLLAWAAGGPFADELAQVVLRLLGQ